MQLAVKAGVGISIAVAGVALGAQLVAARRATPALPPAATEPIGVAADPAPEVSVQIPDPPRYYQIDLDGDGTPELAVEALTDSGWIVIVERLDHTEIGRFPLYEDGNPCAADLDVRDDRLVVQRHHPVPMGCEADDATDYYRVRDGRLARVSVTTTIITYRE
ncbi:MAG TPA: hypothetical protein VMJ10_31030 [Kofleriaceae bacterium]|nr:hypothetical protein [Kofleriaceae bacterium]